MMPDAQQFANCLAICHKLKEHPRLICKIGAGKGKTRIATGAIRLISKYQFGYEVKKVFILFSCKPVMQMDEEWFKILKTQGKESFEIIHYVSYDQLKHDKEF